jgi:hypothetical protein
MGEARPQHSVAAQQHIPTWNYRCRTNAHNTIQGGHNCTLTSCCPAYDSMQVQAYGRSRSHKIGTVALKGIDRRHCRTSNSSKNCIKLFRKCARTDHNISNAGLSAGCHSGTSAAWAALTSWNLSRGKLCLGTPLSTCDACSMHLQKQRVLHQQRPDDPAAHKPQHAPRAVTTGTATLEAASACAIRSLATQQAAVVCDANKSTPAPSVTHTQQAGGSPLAFNNSAQGCTVAHSTGYYHYSWQSTWPKTHAAGVACLCDTTVQSRLHPPHIDTQACTQPNQQLCRHTSTPHSLHQTRDVLLGLLLVLPKTAAPTWHQPAMSNGYILETLCNGHTSLGCHLVGTQPDAHTHTDSFKFPPSRSSSSSAHSTSPATSPRHHTQLCTLGAPAGL